MKSRIKVTCFTLCASTVALLMAFLAEPSITYAKDKPDGITSASHPSGHKPRTLQKAKKKKKASKPQDKETPNIDKENIDDSTQSTKSETASTQSEIK